MVGSVRILWRAMLSEVSGTEHGTPKHSLDFGDVPALGSLFMSAFAGTPDEISKTLDGNARKALAILEGVYGPWNRAASFALGEDLLLGAVITIDHEPYGGPTIAVIAVRQDHHRQGLGKSLLCTTLSALLANGEDVCFAAISHSNYASTSLFSTVGFVPLN